jgi:hypothetical protein
MQGFNREHSLQQRSLFPPSNLSFSSFPPAFTKAEGQDMEQGMGRSRQRASDLSGEADRQRGSKDHNKDRNKNRTVLRPSQSVTGKLTGEDRQLAGNRFSDEYRLKGLRSGSELQISLRTNRFRPDLQLLDARTRRVILDSNAADNMRSLLTFQAQPRREYVLRVTSDAPRKTGRYQLKLDLIGKKVNLQPIVSSGGDAPGTVIDPGQQRGERTESARSLPFNSRYGYGIVDAEAAVLRSLGRTDSTEVANLGGNLWGLDMVRAPEVWAPISRTTFGRIRVKFPVTASTTIVMATPMMSTAGTFTDRVEIPTMSATIVNKDMAPISLVSLPPRTMATASLGLPPMPKSCRCALPTLKSMSTSIALMPTWQPGFATP